MFVNVASETCMLFSVLLADGWMDVMGGEGGRGREGGGEGKGRGEGKGSGGRGLNTHRGTGVTGGICSTRAKTMNKTPMMNSITRKNRIRKGRQAFLGMHLAMTETSFGLTAEKLDAEG